MIFSVYPEIGGRGNNVRCLALMPWLARFEIYLFERALVDWQAVSKTVPADVFLAALLAYRGMFR